MVYKVINQNKNPYKIRGYKHIGGAEEHYLVCLSIICNNHKPLYYMVLSLYCTIFKK